MVKGQINEFFIHGYPAPSIVAHFDIDVTIIDNKYQKIFWSDKIAAYRKIGPNRGVFTGTEKIFSFISRVFSDAMEYAWVIDGMRSAMQDLRGNPERDI